MAGCFVNSINVESNGDNLEARLPCLFFASGLRDLSEVSVTITPTDTLAQIKTKIVDAISSEATRLGYSVPASNMILPAFQKGA
jgi:hypothetical protein